MIKNIINTRWMVIVIMAIVTVIGGVTIVQAWTTPSSSNVSAPITSNSLQQHKEGNLTFNNNLILGRHMYARDMKISGNLQLVGKSNCNLKTDAIGNVGCSGSGTSAMSGPFRCDAIGSGNSSNVTKTCDIPGPTTQVCFLTQVKVSEWDDINSIKCHVYSTPSGWKISIGASDFREIVCNASCIKL